MTGCSCGDCSLCCHPYPSKAAKQHAERMARDMQNIAPHFISNLLGDMSAKWSWRCFFGIHHWTKWVRASTGITARDQHGEIRTFEGQERTCVNCNRLESRRIPI